VDEKKKARLPPPFRFQRAEIGRSHTRSRRRWCVSFPRGSLHKAITGYVI